MISGRREDGKRKGWNMDGDMVEFVDQLNALPTLAVAAVAERDVESSIMPAIWVLEIEHIYSNLPSPPLTTSIELTTDVALAERGEEAC